MTELNRNSTIRELIESKKSLKTLRTMLTVRDTAIKEVFNSAGYFYDSKLKQWVVDDESSQADLTFEQVLEQVRGAESKPRKPKAISKLIEVNSNSNLNPNVEVLNAIGLSKNELDVLKEMILERMTQAPAPTDLKNIYSEVARLKTRKRKNKTFYISEDLTQDIVEFAEDLNVKISQLVEVAMIEMLSKYKSNIKPK